MDRDLPFDIPLGIFREVFQEMEAVVDLYGVFVGVADCFSVGDRAITAYDFQIWKPIEPAFDIVILPGIQDIDYISGFDIHQDGYISLPLTEGKVINACHSDPKAVYNFAPFLEVRKSLICRPSPHSSSDISLQRQSSSSLTGDYLLDQSVCFFDFGLMKPKGSAKVRWAQSGLSQNS